MREDTRGGALHVIFAIFLGLMVTAFIGVGVYTFYPAPDEPINRQIRELRRQQQAITTTRGQSALTAEDRARLQALNEQIDRAEDTAAAAREHWGRNTAIVLVTFATLTMAISLVFAEQLAVVTNGLLLGGVFTMIYGVGWIIVTTTSVSRFLVITAALAITLALGYVRFARGRGVVSAAAGAGRLDSLSDLALRIAALESRMDQAATALARKVGPDRHD